MVRVDLGLTGLGQGVGLEKKGEEKQNVGKGFL